MLPSTPRRGFSLLEVILATAIIASSSMVLLRLISAGGQHQSRSERKAIGQLICQSLLDEMTIDPSLIQSVEDQLVSNFPGWTQSTLVETTEFPGLVRVRVRAAETPVERERTRDDGKFDFELIKWMRLQSQIDEGRDTWEDVP